MVRSILLAAILAMAATPAFASREALQMQDRLIQAMASDGAFDLQEDRFEAVLEAIRAGKRSEEPLGIAFVLWTDGGVRDPEVIANAIRQEPSSEQERKLIELANQLYSLQKVVSEASSDFDKMHATPWTMVARDNQFRWAEEKVAELRGISAELEQKLDVLFEEHHNEMASRKH